ncbi:MAG: ice-binding family protein [Clostridia bacterium]
MKKTRKTILLVSVLAAILLITMAIPVSAASIPKVELGSSSNFAILAGSAISNTGTTSITGDAGGDVGLYPGSAFGSVGVTMSGIAYIADAGGIAAAAKTDLTAAYVDAAGRAATGAIVANLGGTTLTTGVYNSASSISVTGILTLDAQGDPDAVFIFQAGSTLTTAAGSEINLINGARYCRVFWQVGSSATLGTDSKFAGHILAMESITVTTGAEVRGQLLARTSAVTLDSNTIINGLCATAIPPLINVVKTPNPLALPFGGGAVVYTYRVTNPGTVTMSSITVTDDKVAVVTYVSGDTNADSLMQTTEIWIYTGTANLTVTTANIVTAQGQAGGLTAIDTATVTVVVAPAVINPPVINVVKTAYPLTLPSGGGSVTYTYRVTNPGLVALSSVSVADDKIASVTYVSGDANSDGLMQTTEAWLYTGTGYLFNTTTNTVTATGSANGMTSNDTAVATVIVSAATIYPPLINVVKTADPFTLSAGGGAVTYTYRVTNPGVVTLNNVVVTDDKVSPVNYISGDVNADNLLQPDEIWFYRSYANLTATTTNTATAVGHGNGMTVTDTSIATVVLTPVYLYPPIINVVKTPVPLSLPYGGGSATYTYKVTNPGVVALNNVSVSDDKIGTISYISGDVNSDNLLQPSETWTYTGIGTITVTTTNKATAIGHGNDMTATDDSYATVIVAPVEETIDGGDIPETATPWYMILLLGAVVMILALVSIRVRKRNE